MSPPDALVQGYSLRVVLLLPAPTPFHNALFFTLAGLHGAYLREALEFHHGYIQFWPGRLAIILVRAHFRVLERVTQARRQTIELSRITKWQVTRFLRP